MRFQDVSTFTCTIHHEIFTKFPQKCLAGAARPNLKIRFLDSRH